VRGDRHRRRDDKCQQTDEKAAEHPLAARRLTAKTQVAGDDDRHPHQSDDHQGNGSARRSRLRVNGVREQVLTINRGIDGERDHLPRRRGPRMMLPMMRRRPAISPSPGIAVPAIV
jgi:hypothetical protein